MVIGRSIGWSFIDWLVDLKVGDRVHAVCQATVFLFLPQLAALIQHTRTHTNACPTGLSHVEAALHRV